MMKEMEMFEVYFERKEIGKAFIPALSLKEAEQKVKAQLKSDNIDCVVSVRSREVEVSGKKGNKNA